MEKNRAIVWEIRRELERLEGVSVIENSRCRDVSRTNVSVQPDQVVLVTSRAAIRNWDQHHPEHVACIAVRCAKQDPEVRLHTAVVNNREMNYGETARMIWMNDKLEAEFPECVVCMEKASNTETWYCAYCCTPVCRQCHVKLDEIQVSDGSQSMQPSPMTRCPACRKWNLHTSLWGVPSTELLTMAQKPPIDQLMDILQALNGGMVSVYVMTGLECSVVDSIQMCRLTDTNRYMKGSARIGKIHRRLHRLCSRLDMSDASLVFVMIMRWTYAIDVDDDKPVVECSLFRLTASMLQEMHPGSWTNASMSLELMEDLLCYRATVLTRTVDRSKQISPACKCHVS